MSYYKLFVGIDISAKTAHIHWDHPESQQQGNQQIQQNKTSYQQFAKALLKLEANPQRTHLVMEATGNYSIELTFWILARRPFLQPLTAGNCPEPASPE